MKCRRCSVGIRKDGAKDAVTRWWWRLRTRIRIRIGVANPIYDGIGSSRLAKGSMQRSHPVPDTYILVAHVTCKSVPLPTYQRDGPFIAQGSIGECGDRFVMGLEWLIVVVGGFRFGR